jgi:hypothetical protein
MKTRFTLLVCRHSCGSKRSFALQHNQLATQRQRLLQFDLQQRTLGSGDAEILTDNYANKQLIDAEDVSFESVSSEQQAETIDPGY